MGKKKNNDAGVRPPAFSKRVWNLMTEEDRGEILSLESATGDTLRRKIIETASALEISAAEKAADADLAVALQRLADARETAKALGTPYRDARDRLGAILEHVSGLLNERGGPRAGGG